MITFLDRVKSVIESSLPSMATTVSKVIRVVMDRSSNARDVAKIIEQDPGFAADVLKIANSAFNGCSSTIASLQRAVVILGYDTIKNLTSTIGLLSCFTGKKKKARVLYRVSGIIQSGLPKLVN